MKNILFLLLLLSFSTVSTAASENDHALSSYQQRLAYAFGMEVWSSSLDIAPNADVDFFIKGVKDIFKNNSPLLNKAAARIMKWELSRKIDTGNGKAVKDEIPPDKSNPATLTRPQKEGYALGMDFGITLFSVVPELELKYFAYGVKDVFKGGSLQLGGNEARELRNKFKINRDKEVLHKLQQKNLTEGIEFIRNNRTKQGVVTTQSGLQYTIIKEGKGARPLFSDQAVVEYTGRLIDGSIFTQTSRKKGPTILKINRLIPGFAEGLQLMNIGSEYRFFLPARMAYGYKGYGNAVGPYAVLIFDVKLIDVIHN